MKHRINVTMLISLWINYNMRCIETGELYKNGKRIFEINYNMRCIETYMSHSAFQIAYMINYNMRCIETYFAFHIPMQSIWDKLQHEMY